MATKRPAKRSPPETRSSPQPHKHIDVDPEYAAYRALEWLRAYLEMPEDRRVAEDFCERAADYFESQAHKSLAAHGVEPLHKLEGTTWEERSAIWSNEARHNVDFCVFGTPEHLAYATIICADELRTALLLKDAQRAGLAMMALIAAAISGGYDLHVARVDELGKQIAADASYTGIGRRVHGAVSAGGRERSQKYQAIRDQVYQHAILIRERRPRASVRDVANRIARETGMTVEQCRNYLRQIDKERRKKSG